MRYLKRSLIPRFCCSQGGFTLPELLVVVTIIVGLAAIIIPSVAVFATKGEEGGRYAESTSVQDAIDDLMADEGLTVIDGIADGVTIAINSWTAQDVDPDVGVLYVSDYLRGDPTVYYYCFDDQGFVRQDPDGDLDLTDTDFFDATTVCPAGPY